MKFLINSKDLNSVNLDNVINVFVSTNYLMLSLVDGREMRFIYGAEDNLNKLFMRIMEFITSDTAVTLDCYLYIKNL